MHLVSVNVGLPRAVVLGGRDVTTGIFKESVSHSVGVGPEGLEGDGRAEKRRLGDADHAVCAYPIEHYRMWAEALGGSALRHGAFGENLTLSGYAETGARLGDQLRVGSTLLEVAQPRIPCAKLDLRMGQRISRRFLESRKVGFYLRVLEPGRLRQGDEVKLVRSDEGAPTIDDFVRLVHEDYWDVEGLDWLLGARGLAAGWQPILQEKRRRAAQADGWLGTRELKIVGWRQLTDDLAALSLACAFGRALPPAGPGDALALSLPDSRRGPRRLFPLSAGPPHRQTYEVLVWRPGSVDAASGCGVVAGPLFERERQVASVRAGAPRRWLAFERPPPADPLRIIVDRAGAAGVLSVLPELAAGRPHVEVSFLGRAMGGLEGALRAAAGVEMTFRHESGGAEGARAGAPEAALLLVSASGHVVDETERGLLHREPVPGQVWHLARWQASP